LDGSSNVGLDRSDGLCSGSCVIHGKTLLWDRYACDTQTPDTF